MLAMLVSVFWMLCSFVGLICFIMAIVKFFQNGDSTMGIVCLVTIFCGVGGIIAFVYGWMKADAYKMKPIMIAWSIALALGIISGLGLGALSPELPEARLDGAAPATIAFAD